jgi:hypothetical protein
VGGLTTNLTDKKVLIGILAVAVVIVVIVAAFALTVLSQVVFLKNGDYATFDVTGTDQNGNPISGQMKMTVSNVTGASCDFLYEYPGLGVPTSIHHMNQVPALTTPSDLGSKTQDNVNLPTVFGNKNVNIYVKNVDNQVWTSYAGVNPLVQYKIVVTIGSGTMIFVLSQTNIDKVKTGNAA